MWRRELGKMKKLIQRAPDGSVGSGFVLLRTLLPRVWIECSKMTGRQHFPAVSSLLRGTSGNAPARRVHNPGHDCDILHWAHMTKSIPRGDCCCLAPAGKIMLLQALDEVHGKGDHRHADQMVLACTCGAASGCELPGAAATRRRNNDNSRRRACAELLEMQEVDQQAPCAFLQAQDNPDLMDRIATIDKAHVARMKVIIQQRGWPGRSLVGYDGAARGVAAGATC